MAAAIDLVDTFTATRTKGVAERSRSKAAGAFGHETSGERRARIDARRERDREAGKLDERERGELLYLWSGHEAALGVRSVQGAVEDRLMRSPPWVGLALEDALESELSQRGKQGAPRERLVAILFAENVGATRHEARMTIDRMAGAGRVELFVADVERKDPDTGERVLMPTEMARLVERRDRRIPEEVPAEERWARADRAIERECQMMACSESTHAPGSRLPPPSRVDRADAVRATLRAVGSAHRAVIERAYGSATTPNWARLSPEAARLAPLCAAVEKARRAMVEARCRELGARTEESRRGVERSVFATDALRERLDRQPEDEVGRIRWRLERDLFVVAVEREAREMLEAAVRAYREARGNG